MYCQAKGRHSCRALHDRLDNCAGAERRESTSEDASSEQASEGEASDEEGGEAAGDQASGEDQDERPTSGRGGRLWSNHEDRAAWLGEVGQVCLSATCWIACSQLGLYDL